MLAFAFGQLAGLARNILVAHAFGASADLDAFLAANRVSETLFNLIAGGALGSAFIPTFTTLLAKEDRVGAWKLASAVANLAVLILGALAALAAIFAPQIVSYLLAPGFSTDPAQFMLTVSLLRIQLVSAVLFGLSGLVMGILNSHQVFLVPALTPSMYQFGLIFGVLAIAPHFGIYGLAYGVLIGAALHLLLQIPSLAKLPSPPSTLHAPRSTLHAPPSTLHAPRSTPHPPRSTPHAPRPSAPHPLPKYTPTLGLDNPAVGEVIRLMGPRLLGVAVVQLNFWVNTWLASNMAEGSVSGISYGFALMLMAQAAIAQSIATAAMPTLSSQYALGKLYDIRRSLAAALRGVLLLSLPASLGLIILRVPLIQLLYQRGSFDVHDTQLVAWALFWYAAGLVGHSLLEVLARAFYAMHDTKTPVLVGVAAMTLNVIFSFGFSTLFARLGWLPLGGLALANSLATALEAATLFILMRMRLKSLEGKTVALGGIQSAMATLAMSAVLWGWLRLTADRPAWLSAGGGVILGVGVYGVTALVLGIREVKGVISVIHQRIVKRISG